MQTTKITISLLSFLVLALLAMGCGGPMPAAQLQTATPNPVIAVTAAPVTPVSVTGVTLIPSTPNAVAVTATPSVAPRVTAVPAGATKLKYRLLEKFPNFFFCDPDFYPVAHDDEQQRALARFAEIQKDTEQYQTILQHTKLESVANLSDAQKLTVYRDFKKLKALRLEPAGDTYQFQLRTQENSASKTSGMAYEGTITKQGNINVTKSGPTITTCPICLASNTLIDTPAGPIAVKDLSVGMLVWTRDTMGVRVPAPLVKTARVRVPATHQMIQLRLNDGRELLASPGHPTADGRTIGHLHGGEMLDGARVLSVERVTYEDGETYDILPAGATGYYWANGILLGSTLR